MPSDVYVTKISVEKFKKVDVVALNLASTNVLVGGNNSGKSSVLQGIHFSVCAAIASRQIKRDTFSQSSLLYCPARQFVSLRHGADYTNQTNFGQLELSALSDDGVEREYSIKIYRGRNEGNVGCIRSGDPALHPIVANATNLFSIYVPGLAGIPQVEEYRSESVVRRGVAGGDANLYLRNVLLLIQKQGQVDRLKSLMGTVFPGFDMLVRFDEAIDVYIDVQVWYAGDGGHKCPLELVGTGVLQALQIFSYITLFEPSLLLLDEPDSHLHPDNQGLLATTLQVISLQTTTQVILTTHSRHLVEALQGEANFVWLKNGNVVDQGQDLDRLPLLLDLGALDTFDRLAAGEIEWVVLTEDSKIRLMESLLQHCGFEPEKVAVYTYKSSSNIHSALALAAFINRVRPSTQVLIHRDRDFMTDAEVAKIEKMIEDADAIPFITSGSDLESYFVTPAHLAHSIGVTEAEVSDWLDVLAETSHIDFQHRFTRKRDEIKYSTYRGKWEDCPDTQALLGTVIPLPPEKRVGKAVLKLVRAGMAQRFGSVVDPLLVSPHLRCDRLREIVASDTTVGL